MTDFYFIYGTADYFPFEGGWTRVTAPDIDSAIETFRKVHPDRIIQHHPVPVSLINCAEIRSTKHMECMLNNGDPSNYEHEHLVYQTER